MSTVRQAVVYSSASRYVMRFIGLVSTMLVARLLTPSEIGTFAVASAIVMIMSEFRILGAGAWLVRENDIPEEKVRTALGLTVLISWGLGVVVFLMAPAVAAFYDLPPIEFVFRILSISFLFAPYISIPTSLLSRRYQFKTLFWVKLVATLTGFVTTITLILLEYSFYALAWGYTATILAEFMMITWLRPPAMVWRPTFRNLMPVASFGVFNSIANMLKRATVTVPDMVIGKMGTTAQVGMYSRGLGFVEFVSQTLITGVNPVVLPYLSDTKRSGGSLQDAYIRASVLMGALVWPVLAVVSLASLPTIRLFFGNQWDAAAPIASWLAIWAMLRTAHWFSTDLFLANGNERLMAVKESGVFALLFVGIVVAFPYGLERVAQVFVLVGVVEFFVTALLLKRTIGLRLFVFCQAWVKTLALTLICALVTAAIGLFVPFDGEHVLVPIVVIALVLPTVWIVSLFFLQHPLWAEVQRMYSKISGR